MDAGIPDFEANGDSDFQLQVSGWSRVMCLNRARQRRRHRRGVSDWGHLFHHAANADASPEFQAWMEQAGWRPPPPENNRAEEQVTLCKLVTLMFTSTVTVKRVNLR